MKKVARFIFSWVFSKEIQELRSEIEAIKEQKDDINRTMRNAESVHAYMSKQMKTVDILLKSIDASVDVHESNYSPSWAVVSLQGQKSDFIKFIELKDADIESISRFLRQFEKAKIDATPQASRFLRIKNK